MAIIFNALLSGWIRNDDWDNVQSTYGDNFRRVNVRKDGWNNSTSYLMNRVTRDLYTLDSAQVVAVKCFFLTIGTPIYTAARMVFHAGRSIYLIGTLFAKAVSLFNEDLRNSMTNGVEAFFQRFIINLTCEIFTEAFLGQLWECIKAPYYGLGLWIAAIEGFVHDPYKAKMEIALIERYWNGDKDRRHDVRSQRGSCMEKIQQTDAFFLARCMQSAGTYDNPEYIERSDNGPVETNGCVFPPLISTACC